MNEAVRFEEIDDSSKIISRWTKTSAGLIHSLTSSYGPPVPLDDLNGRDTPEAARIATERLMKAIYDLRATL